MPVYKDRTTGAYSRSSKTFQSHYRINISRNHIDHISGKFVDMQTGMGMVRRQTLKSAKKGLVGPHSYVAMVPAKHLELMELLAKAHPLFARTFKKERYKLVKKNLIPVIKKVIPRSQRKLDHPHLRVTPKIVVNTLEKVRIETGRAPNPFYAAIVHARWLPYYPTAWKMADSKFWAAYNVFLRKFIFWMASVQISRTEGTKDKFVVSKVFPKGGLNTPAKIRRAQRTQTIPGVYI